MDEKLTKKERKELKREKKERELGDFKRKKALKRAVLWVVIFAGVAGVAWLMATSSNKSSFEANISQVGQVSADDWVKGLDGAPAVLVEYSDFQCPACASFFPVIKQLISEFGDDILFTYRHFPLKQIHGNAELAGRAAEAAGGQGKFWEMHDLIFENQSVWANERNAEDIFVAYADFMDLNVAKFKNDLASDKVKNKLENDYQNAVNAGLNSTPTFFLNGQKIQPKSYDEFRDLVAQAVNQGGQ